MKKLFGLIAVLIAILMLSSCIDLTGLIGNLIDDSSESQTSVEPFEQLSEMPSEPPSEPPAKPSSIPESSSETEISMPSDGKSKIMVDYIGMTVNELAEIWGSDYQLTEYWDEGAAKGVYYDDLRIPFMFYFIDEGIYDGTLDSDYTGDEIIEIVQCFPGANDDYFVSDDVIISLTFDDLHDNIQGEYYSMWYGEEFCFTYDYDDSTSVFFTWENDELGWSEAIDGFESNGEDDLPKYLEDEIAEFLYNSNAMAECVEVVKKHQW